MRPLTFFVPAVLLCLIPIAPAAADDRLDQALAEIRALRESVQRLEARLEQLESDRAAEAPAAAVAAAPDNDSGDLKNWFDSMRVELKKAEARASGAWTKPAVWEQIRAGMEEEEAIAILGEPTRRKFSLRKDTDEILVYEGDLLGDGDLVEGELRIYKGRVRRFEAPDFPSEPIE